MDTPRDAIGRVLAEEQAHRRTQRRAALILAVSLVLGLGALAYGLKELARSHPAPVAVDVSKLPPIRPGPER